MKHFDLIKKTFKKNNTFPNIKKSSLFYLTFILNKYRLIIMVWNPIWEDIFLSQEWGKYPGEPLIRFVARNFYHLKRSNIRILELGCGPGANLWYCAKEGFKIYGVEGSSKAVELCTNRLNSEIPKWEGEIIIGDVTELPYQDSYFDAVIDNECCSCLNFEDTKKTYLESNRVLKSNGKLFIRTFSQGSYGDQTGKRISKDMWVTDKGNTLGKGPIRFTKKEDFDLLFPKEIYANEVIEIIKESKNDRNDWIIEWILEYKKII